MAEGKEQHYRALQSDSTGQPAGILITSFGQEVIPNVWIGGYAALESKSFLRKNGITHILSIGHFKSIYRPSEYMNKIIPLSDDPEARIIEIFEETYTFIDEALSLGHRILVHCLAGVSRSPTVVTAYLMKKRGMTPEEALALIRESRPIVCPNPGFLKQLELYHSMDCVFNPRAPAYLAYLNQHPHDQRHIGHSDYTTSIS